MKDTSIWLDNIVKDKFPNLDKDIECDILIVGGGITGFSTAYFLRDSGKKIVLVEGNKICQGTTAKSTGKLTYLQGDTLQKIIDTYDVHTCLRYIESQKYAIRLAKKIILDNDIKCNLEPVNSYIYTNKSLKTSSLKDTYYALKKHVNIKLKNNLPVKMKCHKVIEANDTFVFHPVKFVLGLVKTVKDKINIYENTRITDIEDEFDYYIAHTSKYKIKAKKVVLACHYPFFIIPYFFPFKTTIEKSFLTAASVDKTKAFSAINIDKEVLSMRYYKDKNNYAILLSETSSLDKGIDNLKKRDNAIWNMKKTFSQDIKYCWSNHDIMTSDHLPLIGEIKKNLFLATGFNTWGMTNGILAGKIVKDLIIDGENEYKDLFNPTRDEKGIPNIIGYNLQNSLSFIDTKLDKNRDFYRKDVKVIKEKGIYYGIYVDENKKEHKVFNQCPHMKCNLSFNYQTNTWDCPCHGSSFDIDGNIIYGPSKEDIKIKEIN